MKVQWFQAIGFKRQPAPTTYTAVDEAVKAVAAAAIEARSARNGVGVVRVMGEARVQGAHSFTNTALVLSSSLSYAEMSYHTSLHDKITHDEYRQRINQTLMLK